MAEAVRAGAEVYTALRKLLSGRASRPGSETRAASPGDRRSRGSAQSDRSGDQPGRLPPGRDGVAIALDPAASEFYRDGTYHVAGESLSSDDMIGRYEAIIDNFPVWSWKTAWPKATGTAGCVSPSASVSACR